MANPLYGTTRSHMTVLWHLRGGENVIDWFDRRRQQGTRLVGGNATVKNLVAVGKCNLGWTDTDDVFVAIRDGQPVSMHPVRVDGGSTICIPNTVSIIRGTKRLANARQLVEFLLSKQSQLALARSKSRQIPLCPTDVSELPPEVRPLLEWAADSIDMTKLGDARRECLEWMISERLQ